MSSILPRSLNKPLENIRAVITTKWDRGYAQRVVGNVESFFIDSSLDNDADSFEVQIGDPNGDFLAMLDRNHEVRISIISSSPGAAGHIFTGISDDIVFDQTGVMVVSGRDYSSLALDSICPPVRYKSVKAKYVVANQARKLGFTNISLSDIGEVKKTIRTDGSETYWEFWYRLYRNEKMWLYVGPNGALVGTRLNYDQPISYYFGTPQQTDSRAIASMHVPVETVTIRKSTQGRLGSVWVLVKDGTNTFWVKTGLTDPTMDGWLKKPFKIITDTVSHSVQKGRQKGWEEIFEGKVGSLEIQLEISDPTQIFRTNRIARLRIPEIGYGGEFFVVGWRMQADNTGIVQEIRLRDKYIALSRRVPAEPVITPPKTLPKFPTTDKATAQQESDILTALIPNDHGDWGDYFYKAAQNFHGAWDADLFLAALLGMSWIDTRISNIREKTGHHDGTEWTKPPQEIYGPPDPRQYGPPAPTATDLYHETFANKLSTVESLGIAHKELAVGPMQLKTVALKEAADNRFTKGGGTSTSTGITANKIDAYLKTKNSPLAGTGADHVSSGKKHNVDPRMIVAISGAETSFGTNGSGPAIHNAWGMFDKDSNNIEYSSWQEGIEAVAANLGGPIYIGAGNTTVAEVGAHWAPVGAGNDPNNMNAGWVPNVTKFLQDLGGIPSDITFQGSPDGQDTPTAANHDEYDSGRWDPESNIWIGGQAFADALTATGDNPTDGDQKSAMWAAAAYYNGDEKTATGDIDSTNLRKAVMINPGFLGLVAAAIPALRANSRTSAEGNTSGATSSNLFPGDWPTEAQCQAAFTSGTYVRGVVGNPPLAVLPSIKFLQAKYYEAGRPFAIKWIVIHDMEAPESNETAQNVANMFATGGTDGPASAHYCLDDENIIQCVKDSDTAYGVIGSNSEGQSINSLSLHFEHAGYAAQTLADWQDTFSTKMLQLSAKLTAKKAKAYGIPLVHVTGGGLTVGSGQSGFVGHGDFTAAFNTPGGHTDPGSNFPWISYMNLVQAAYDAL